MKRVIFSSRSTRIASVGVCTRPTVVLWKPLALILLLNAVIARVPLMPTSQSASERHFAASASGSSSRSARRPAKPSRIAPCVIDCSHRRWIGFFAFACCTM